MMIFWLTCLVGYPRTSAPEPRKLMQSYKIYEDLSSKIEGLPHLSQKISKHLRNASSTKLATTNITGIMIPIINSHAIHIVMIFIEE